MARTVRFGTQQSLRREPAARGRRGDGTMRARQIPVDGTAAPMLAPEISREDASSTVPFPAPASVVNSPAVRLTGVLVEDGALLLERVCMRELTPRWTLPGGKLEYGETLQQCLAREMREETGLAVEVGELLYVCDRFHGLGSHVVDMSFLVRRVPGSERMPVGPQPGSDDSILSVEMVPVSKIESHGMSARFAQLVSSGFPGRGSYCGEFHAFYG